MTQRRGLSSPNNVLWPAAGITKAELWDYYLTVAGRMLSAIAERPLTLNRYPNGVERSGFVQKHLGDDAPAHLHRYTAWSPSSKRDVSYLIAAGVDELRWMAQMAVVEVHAWLAHTDRPDRPDGLLFDLDPSGPRPSVHQAALWVRAVLDELGLPSRVKTSGKRGLHIVVRIERRYESSDVRALALAIARCIADRHPDELTVEMRKADRGDRLLLDWSRHGTAQTTVAAWSPRVTPTATVSVPLTWDEVTAGFDPTTATIRTAPDRPDHWAEPATAQRLESVRAEIERRGYDVVDRSPRARTTR